MSENTGKLDNKGFTLVELLVSLLVSSMVVMAASFCLSVSIRSFSNTNREVSLQMESQIAQNLVENLIIQSSSCVYTANYNYGEGSCPLLKIGCVDGTSSKLYLIILDTSKKMLLLKKLTDTDPATYENVTGTLDNEDDVKSLVAAAISSDRPALLANYCSSFVVTPNEMLLDTDDLVRISLEFELGDKNFKSSTNVSLRNGEHR